MFVRRALLLSIPAWLFSLIGALARMPSIDVYPEFECVENYAGVRTIQMAFQSQSRCSAALDKLYASSSDSQNFCTDLGFLVCILYCLKLLPRGLDWWATVCSTWIWVSRSSVKRSAKRALGAEHLECVAEANSQVARMCLCIRLCCANFCRFGIEQPGSSLMKCTPRMQALSTKIPSSPEWPLDHMPHLHE